MIIDCDSCEVRGLACGDCVVTALLGAPPSGFELDDGERLAFGVLASSGLVPPLRLVVADEVAFPDPECVRNVEDHQGAAPDAPNVTNYPHPHKRGHGRSVAAG